MLTIINNSLEISFKNDKTSSPKLNASSALLLSLQLCFYEMSIKHKFNIIAKRTQTIFTWLYSSMQYVVLNLLYPYLRHPKVFPCHIFLAVSQPIHL